MSAEAGKTMVQHGDLRHRAKQAGHHSQYKDRR
jgi:hypothetical protein